MEQQRTSTMRGREKELSNTGCPWPGGAEVEFTQADVAQLGKLYCWGSSCVQFIVRLRDGREVARYCHARVVLLRAAKP